MGAAHRHRRSLRLRPPTPSASPRGLTGGPPRDPHPAPPPTHRQHGAAPRWISRKDSSGPPAGAVAHPEPAGDGVRAFIVSSREGTLASWTLHNRKAEHKIEPVAVKQGDTLDFVVDFN